MELVCTHTHYSQGNSINLLDRGKFKRAYNTSSYTADPTKEQCHSRNSLIVVRPPKRNTKGNTKQTKLYSLCHLVVAYIDNRKCER